MWEETSERNVLRVPRGILRSKSFCLHGWQVRQMRSPLLLTWCTPIQTWQEVHYSNGLNHRVINCYYHLLINTRICSWWERSYNDASLQKIVGIGAKENKWNIIEIRCKKKIDSSEREDSCAFKRFHRSREELESIRSVRRLHQFSDVLRRVLHGGSYFHSSEQYRRDYSLPSRPATLGSSRYHSTVTVGFDDVHVRRLSVYRISVVRTALRDHQVVELEYRWRPWG